MHRSARSLVTSLALAVCLWPIAASAQSQDIPKGPALTVDDVRDAFAGAGYQVDQAHAWDWTSPPVTTFQVRGLADDRVLMVLVYPDAAAAQTVRQQAQALDPDRSDANPHLVPGYGQSVWNANVAVVQSSQSALNTLSAAQDDQHGPVVVPDLTPLSFPNVAVNLDFQQALNDGIVNV